METLYNRIGDSYDITRRADPEIARLIRNHLDIPNGSKVLDAACGTGNYTVALAQSGLEMVGVDISSKMISQAHEKSSVINWEVANIEKLPFENNYFNGIACILAIHHFESLLKSFQEIYRCLDFGSRFVIFTSTPEQINLYWLKEYFPKAIEASAKQMPTLAEVTKALGDSGFSIVGTETFLVQPDLEDFFLYSGKFKPELYLDPQVRAGISTFANLSSEEDVEDGCKKLKHDIDTNQVEKVISKYSSYLGDYLFIIAEKK
ncbi:class I SAM-dependent methyltransferase [Litchfieldia alkalitelluris]|uniref:class I SAM-dependent methyltransferase n=1 Tax=Litchfieldia alkalitelluris TaxID=304268 RepID=UPI000996A877|nr:methyltransferase domain-containing protein [Litchfieldia alkalitelluris]